MISAVVDFIEENDADYIHEAVEVLECLAEAKGIKDEELEVIGESDVQLVWRTRSGPSHQRW